MHFLLAISPCDFNTNLSSSKGGWNKTGGGGYCHLWAIWVCATVKGIVFQAVYSRIGYIIQRVWVENRGSFFRKLISWLKILSRLGKQLL